MTRAEKPRKENFQFTAEQIGSEILERFSQDIYNPKAIIRELVKNAYDSYFQLESHLEKIGQDLDIDCVVKVDLIENNIMISDEGLGLDIPDLQRLVSIALTDKRDIPGVTGFRGIGFWSAYTGGDAIVVESTKFGIDRLYRLRLNTKRMRQLQGPIISIGRIMGDPDCVQLESESAEEEAHFTKVLILAESDEARLRSLISDPELMRKVLLEGCSCRLADGSNHADCVKSFYETHGIQPAQILFQNEEITKEIPSGVGEISTRALEIVAGNRKVILARAWYATNTQNERLKTPIAGLRICREGFPIGRPNIYSDRQYPDSNREITRADLLSWHIGEVHLVHDELRPDASGEGVRDSVLFVQFREKLREFYAELIEASYEKQRRVSFRTEYRKMQETVVNIVRKKTLGQKLSDSEREEIKRIATVTQRDNDIARKKLPEGTSRGSREALIRDGEVKKLRRQILKTIQEIGPENDFGDDESAKTAPKKNPSKNGKPAGQPTAASPDSNLIPKPRVLAFLEELRDAAMEILEDEPSLRQDMIARINEIAGRL